MGLQKYKKLSLLIKTWPNDVVAIQSWLENQGISRQLARKYCQSGWLEKIGQGAYIRAGDKVSWLGGLCTLQQQALLPIHVGGVTALGLQGYGHFIPLGKKEKVYLYDHDKRRVRLPNWFIQQFSEEVEIIYVHRNLFDLKELVALKKHEEGNIDILISTPERAILEVIEGVPNQFSYEHAYYLMEGLQTLRPRLLQQLLEACLSIKVKRLFLHLAELCHMPWFKRLAICEINLGRGKRIIGTAQVFDEKYNIVVPRPPTEEGYKE